MGIADTTGSIETFLRGCEGVYAREELERKLKQGRPLNIKLGMDPTAPDIHLGHAVVLRKMRQFQDAGHKATLIIGDYTAKIGDPTGRDSTRPILDDATIAANAQTYLDQAGQVLDMSEDKLVVRRNSEWLSELSFADVLRLTGQITVQQMLHRENFKLRMDKQAEIMVSEFMYPLMQAYDSVVIRADVELGGTDQTFNNLLGRQLQEKDGQEKQVVLTMPLLVGIDGTEKMSKSKGNTVALTADANEMFGRVMSIPDALMVSWFTLLTELPPERIASLTNAQHTHPREAKDVLGRVIVEAFHGRDAAGAASAEFKRRFAEKQLPSDLEVNTVPESPIGILSLVSLVGFASSNSEARRLVQQNAVSIDDEKIADPKAQITVTDGMILRVGKRRVCQLKP